MKFNQKDLIKLVFQTLKEEDEKLNDKTKLINKKLDVLKQKDTDPYKTGIQGLSNEDLALFKKLNLAKALAKLREKKKVSL